MQWGERTSFLANDEDDDDVKYGTATTIREKETEKTK